MLSSLTYKLYERYLLSQVLQSPCPRHIAVILDGNRRWAANRKGLSIPLAYERGVRKVVELLDWCQKLEIPEVTLWVLSTDNLKRPIDQVMPLLRVIEEQLGELARYQQLSRTPRQIRCFGHLESLPNSLRIVLEQAMETTARVSGNYLNIAIAYGGRQEIVDAVQRLLDHFERQGMSLREAAERINADEIASQLYLPDTPEPDLIIRTSGEVRLSGFLMWQSAYSEFYFCDANWPAFRQIDFLRAIRSYQQRNRRHGR